GRIVTSAALIVIVVAGSFAFADIVLIKALGVGIAIAVALDATIVRALLVPAAMRLLGRWNWWLPRSVARRLPALRTAEPAPAARDRARGGRRVSGRLSRPLATFGALVGLIGAACSGPILANAPISFPSPPATSTPASRAPDPVPIAFPRDDGPHDRLTEWWYYTGHLHAADGRRFGFEAVGFRAERGSFPPSRAPHPPPTRQPAGGPGANSFPYTHRRESGP